MIVVVIGVAGSGKTTVGTMLAGAMHCPFLEGDSLHPAANVEKMTRGIPLTDVDRAPWLAAIYARLLAAFRRGRSLVVGCSALKQSYREALAEGIPITWVYLRGSAALIRSRLQHRTGHYMKADMLASQFEALEEPSDAIVADVSQLPGAILEQILTELRGPAHADGRPNGPNKDDPASCLEFSVKPDVRVFPDANELSLRAAEAAVEAINEAVGSRATCSLVLSGGSTPRIRYGLLESRFHDQIPWAQVHVFWGRRAVCPAQGCTQQLSDGENTAPRSRPVSS